MITIFADFDDFNSGGPISDIKYRMSQNSIEKQRRSNVRSQIAYSLEFGTLPPLQATNCKAVLMTKIYLICYLNFLLKFLFHFVTRYFIGIIILNSINKG